MISQVLNAVNLAPGNPAPASPLAELKPQKPAAPVELPEQSVQAVERMDAASVKTAAEQINKFLQQFDRNLQFSVDEETGVNVVRVVDAQSQEVIRQMPTEEMLAIARALDKLQGLLIKDKV